MSELSEQVKKMVKQNYVFGIIAAILMIILGVIMIFSPVASLGALLWIIALGFLVGGVFRIYSYYKLPYMLRQGFTIATGVIDIICSIMMIVAMVIDPGGANAVFAWFIGFMFGFYALFAGINTLVGSGAARRMGASSGWLVASGILEIIAGIMLLFVPQVGTLFLMYMLAFTFIVCGISLIAASIDLKNRSKSFDEVADQLGEDFDLEDPFGIWRR